MVKNCPRCGNPNSPANRYCSTCGAQLTEREPQSDTSSQDAQGSGGYAVQSWDQGEIPEVVAEDDSSTGTGDRYRSDPSGAISYSSRTPISGEVMPPIDPLSPPSRTDLPPNAGERQEQATFVPYTDEAARKLEKQKPENAWLMPTILGAGAILAVLVIVTIFLLLTNGNGTPGSQIASGNLAATPLPQPTLRVAPTAVAQSEATSLPIGTLNPMPTPITVSLPCELPSGATVSQALIYTVCHSSEEQIRAWQTLDTEILKGSRTGFDLQDNIARVEKFKADNQYADPVLNSLVVVAMKVDQNAAFVQTAESWAVTTYSSVDKSVVGRSGPTPYSEVYHLVKQADKWLVDRVEFITATTP